MTTKIIRTNTFLTVTLATLIAGCGCGDSAPNAVENEHYPTTGTDATSGTDVTGTTTEDPATADTRGTNVNSMDPMEIRINGSAAGTPAYNERYAASKDVRGYRSALMAELEAIRLRLNDGTRPNDVTLKDQARAADLAQGLERMDRLILAVEESDDLTWTSIRSSSLKEAEDVRTWATEHGYKVNS